MWNHEHSFQETQTGTRMVDKIDYQVPGGIFAPLIHQLKVRNDIESIFNFRETIIDQLFSNTVTD
jgi:ligand-binding SRPBCC domain-containing protein